MKKLLMVATVVLLLFAVMAPASADPPSCNWGELTQTLDDMGPHASDPSGDGHGPGTMDEPRVGLANVIQQGDLEAACLFLGSLS